MSAPRGAVLQRDGQTYAVVPWIKGGLITPEILEKLAQVARKYQIPVMKLTFAGRIALVGLKAEDVEAVWADLGLPPAPAVGPCLRSVQSCPGTAACRLALQDSLGLGMRLEEKFGGVELPGKMKVGISGCPICCAESWVRDFGAFGKKSGFTVVVGGNAAQFPRIGEVLAEGLAAEEVERVFEKLLDLYRREGQKGERFGNFAHRVGIERLKAEAGV
ncbi:nitrite and sulphite reductase 4Fe-4S region [Ammonifex degensii KC4]|uniref:Nitrite and sulphite reductase 4Fe-4S region n=1 Tax=Ammonifex degensii (strain DSM 10501 / KC4) TaxID=429009 RepID=C9RDC3_AMMDK|nr:nitrite and sulphite reductase 4Fe-4S region [Ammonifex degensii KC4]